MMPGKKNYCEIDDFDEKKQKKKEKKRKIMYFN